MLAFGVARSVGKESGIETEVPVAVVATFREGLMTRWQGLRGTTDRRPRSRRELVGVERQRIMGGRIDGPASNRRGLDERSLRIETIVMPMNVIEKKKIIAAKKKFLHGCSSLMATAAYPRLAVA